MLDIGHLEKYKPAQIQGELNGLKAGKKLYNRISYIFLGLTILFFVLSLIFGILLLTNVINDEHFSYIDFVLSYVFIALFCACLIVMVAMFITTRYKYVIRINLINEYLKKHERSK